MIMTRRKAPWKKCSVLYLILSIYLFIIIIIIIIFFFCIAPSQIIFLRALQQHSQKRKKKERKQHSVEMQTSVICPALNPKSGCRIVILYLIITKSLSFFLFTIIKVHTKLHANRSSSFLVKLVTSRQTNRIRLQNPDPDPDQLQKLHFVFLWHTKTAHQISCKSIKQFLSKIVQRQTDKQTDKYG